MIKYGLTLIFIVIEVLIALIFKIQLLTTVFAGGIIGIILFVYANPSSYNHDKNPFGYHQHGNPNGIGFEDFHHQLKNHDSFTSKSELIKPILLFIVIHVLLLILLV